MREAGAHRLARLRQGCGRPIPSCPRRALSVLSDVVGTLRLATFVVLGILMVAVLPFHPATENGAEDTMEGSDWCILTIDTLGSGHRETSLDLDSNDLPHVAYFDPANHDLKYARWTEGDWSIETVTGAGSVGWWPSIVVDSVDHAHISYHNSNTTDLMHAKWTGSNWSFQTVDSSGWTGVYSSIDLDSSDWPHVSYHNWTATTGALKYARWTGSEWAVEAVDSVSYVVYSTELDLDSSDRPHIAYQNDAAGDVMYARWTGSEWRTETVDSAGRVGDWLSFALDSLDRAHLAYSNLRNGEDLKYARWTGTDWSIETIESGSDARAMSIAVDSFNRPHISYAFSPDGYGVKLKYAWWTGSNWSIETVDSGGWGGRATSIALDSLNRPHISYWDSANDRLKYATRGPCPGASRNRPPFADAGGGYIGLEGSPLTLDASGSSDPEGDLLSYRWDVDGDGTWDTPWSPDPTATYVWGDDWTGTVRLEVSDGNIADTDEASVAVSNVAPAIDFAATYAVADVRLRVAGEKWHHVRMDLMWNGGVADTASVTRYPGSPDNQSAAIEGARLQLLGDFRITLNYKPADDPVNGQPNGATPVWVVITAPDGSEVWFQHTFNVHHPDTWTWTLDDFRPFLIGQEIMFEVTASDIGSDDLTVAWDFGDWSSAVAIFFNDGVGPDPTPSPEVNPITVTSATTHSFEVPGMYTVTLTLTDDDGGMAAVSFTLVVG